MYRSRAATPAFGLGVPALLLSSVRARTIAISSPGQLAWRLRSAEKLAVPAIGFTRPPPASRRAPQMRVELPINLAPAIEAVPADLVRVAEAAADAARIVVKRWYRCRELPIEYKGDDSPVSIADKQAERAIREVIGAAFPDHVVLGEEEGGVEDKAAVAKAAVAEYSWVCTFVVPFLLVDSFGRPGIAYTFHLLQKPSALTDKSCELRVLLSVSCGSALQVIQSTAREPLLQASPRSAP
jgi:Inositol monophosphatase family